VLDLPQFVLDRMLAEKPVFTADEVARWPDGLLSLLEDYELIQLTDNASSVVCDACGHDHVEPVTKLPLPNGAGFRAYMVCPYEGRIWVPLDRLRQWMLDVPKLTEMTGWTPPAPISCDGSIDDPICLSVTEAARYIGVTDRTVREWRTNGKLAVVEDDNGQLLFSKSSLEILRQARQ
jgi:excisionase family DNA binding protein